MRVLPVVLFAVLASPVTAQSFTHKASEFSLGAYRLEGQGILSGFNADGIILSARSDFAFTPTFGLQGNLGFDRMETEFETFEQTTFGLHGYYELSGGNRVGVFLQRRTTAFEFNTLTDDSYGVEGLWSVTPQFSVEAYLGAGQTGQDSGSGVDTRLWGVRGDYDVTEALRLHLSYDYSEYDGSDRITDARIGVDYSFAGGASGVPLVASFEYASYDLNLPDNFDRYTLSVTVPLGPDGSTSRRKLFHDRGALTNVFPVF